MQQLVAVALGSALGGMARYWVTDAVDRRLSRRFPWGTLVVNGSGAAAAGALAALLIASPWFALDEADVDGAAALLLIGFCGSYTTVSTFALQTLDLAQGARWLMVVGNIFGSLLFCLGGAWLTFTLLSAVLAF
ncbi:fluoride efflux transporter FluC [Halorhodospira abdelmalekii]|uniref:fluoride efflux transporter FluC n=1 Tax=Halorhodospira abdelmalekii TaxID=421629 RepID=UPI0030845D90